MTWLCVFLGAACPLDPAVQLFLLSFFPRRSNLISRHQHYPVRAPAGWDGAYHHPRERRCRGRARSAPGLRYGPLRPRASGRSLVRPRSTPRISRYPDIQMYDVYVTFSVSSLVYRATSSGIEQAAIRIPSSERARVRHLANLSRLFRASARDGRSATRDSNVGGEGVIFATWPSSSTHGSDRALPRERAWPRASRGQVKS